MALLCPDAFQGGQLCFPVGADRVGALANDTLKFLELAISDHKGSGRAPACATRAVSPLRQSIASRPSPGARHEAGAATAGRGAFRPPPGLEHPLLPPGFEVPAGRGAACAEAVPPPPGLRHALSSEAARFVPRDGPQDLQGQVISIDAALATQPHAAGQAQAPTTQPHAARKRALRRATLVIAYFPRAASDEEVCLALDRAVGRANSVLRCEVVREGGLYGVFEFADEELAELALQVCSNGKLIMRDHTQKKWYLHASRSRHIILGKGMSGSQRRNVRAPRVQVPARDKSDDRQDDSDTSTALGSGRTRSVSPF